MRVFINCTQYYLLYHLLVYDHEYIIIHNSCGIQSKFIDGTVSMYLILTLGIQLINVDCTLYSYIPD